MTAHPHARSGTTRTLLVLVLSFLLLLGLLGYSTAFDGDPIVTASASVCCILLLLSILLRKRLDELSAQQQRHLQLLESAVVHARDAVVILDATAAPGRGRSVLYVNESFTRMTGYPAQEVLGRSLHFLRGPKSDAATLERIRAALEAGTPLQVELLNYRKDGSELWVELSLMPVLNEGHVQEHWIMIQRDIGDRRIAEELLRRSEERYRQLFEANPQPMWLYDQQSLQILAVNAAAVKKYGYSREEFLTLTMKDIRSGDETPRTISAVERGSSQSPTLWQHRTKAGKLLNVEISAFPLTLDERNVVLILAHDVTQRLRLEDQLRHAQKMDAVGQMAGGIAHDFNNLLTGLIGNLSLIRLPEGDPNQALLSTAERAAQRAAELTRKLLHLSRKTQLQLISLRIEELIEETVELVRSTFDRRIEIVTEIRPVSRVAGDAVMLNQVVLNLCLNARDAMPDGGRLTVSARQVSVNHGDSGRPPDVTPGQYVRLSVSDTGTGISPEVRLRLFEPFFTTKPVGQGTGLGLAMVHSIVQQHGGWIECESELGKGTRFAIFLPIIDSTTPPPSRGSGLVSISALSRRTLPPEPLPLSCTILLADDEQMIRDIGRTVLEGAGFRVLEAADGAEAVRKFREHRAEIRLVILDLTMPELSGRDSFRAITEIDPDAKVLLSTGFSSDDLSDVTGALGLLLKPYRPAELLAAVQRFTGSGTAKTGNPEEFANR